MIYICIPAHNEERTIGVLLWKVRNLMGEFGRDYELLVLDDASTDDTPGTLDRYRKVLPLRIFNSKERLGYARSVERLIHEALHRTSYPKRDIIIILQGDFTEHPEHVITLAKTMEGGADIVAGCVEDDRRGYPKRFRLARWIAPWVLGRTFSDAPVSDPLCGFRAFRIIVFKKAMRAQGNAPLMHEDGWAADLTLLTSLAPYARRLEEVPIKLRFDIRSRPSRLSVVRTLRGLLRVRGERWRSPEQEDVA